MSAKRIKLTRWHCTCERCGNEWESQTANLPTTCAKCRSPYWNKPKTPKATYWYRNYQGENKYELSITGATEQIVLKALSDRKARWLALDRDLAKDGDTVYGEPKAG